MAALITTIKLRNGYRAELHLGNAVDVLAKLPSQSVQMCVTSPPYFGLRDYGVDGQLGLEQTPDAYVAKLVDVFREVRRVLRDDGTLWLNLGDSYASSQKGSGGPSAKQLSNAGSRYEMSQRLITGLADKQLIGIPWRVAFALQADGWYLRSDIIWHKPNPMPESVTDRPTRAHEYLFLLAKSERYYYDAKAIAEPTKAGARVFNEAHAGNIDRGDNGRQDLAVAIERNKRSVWIAPTQAYSEAHFATFPEALITPCILAGCPQHGTVLDTFSGSGTTGVVSLRHGRNYIGVELNPAYLAMSARRIRAGNSQGNQFLNLVKA